MDLTEDGIKDISVLLKSINIITKKATIIVIRLEEGSAGAGVDANSQSGDKQGNGNKEIELSKKFFSIKFVIIFILVFLAMAVTYIILKRRRRLKSY